MLTELTVKNAKPREKSYMIRDEHGLYLRIDPTGNKYWIFRYWENKKVRMSDRAESYVRTVKIRLNKYILPEIGELSLKKITSADILRICRKIEASGYDETARRVKTLISQVFCFAIASNLTDSDPASALRGALKPKNVNIMRH